MSPHRARTGNEVALIEHESFAIEVVEDDKKRSSDLPLLVAGGEEGAACPQKES